MTSYGRFKQFEIRDTMYLFGGPKHGEFDLVRWADNNHCYSIAGIKWNPKEGWWDVDCCGTRLLEEGTEELSKWLLKWLDMEKVVMECDNNEESGG